MTLNQDIDMADLDDGEDVNNGSDNSSDGGNNGGNDDGNNKSNND